MEADNVSECLWLGILGNTEQTKCSRLKAALKHLYNVFIFWLLSFFFFFLLAPAAVVEYVVFTSLECALSLGSVQVSAISVNIYLE